MTTALAVPVRPLVRRFALLLFAVGLALLILHAVAGRHFVVALHDGSLIPVLGDVLKGRTVYDVNHYHRVLNERVKHLLITIAIVALALLSLSVPSHQMLPAVLSLDVLFMVIDRWYDAAGRPPQLFSISKDGSHPETFQYLKEAGVVAGFVGLSAKRYFRMYVIWAGLFLYVVFDDALRIHETLGLFLSTRFHFSAVMGLRPQDLGELLVMGSVGILFIALMVPTYFGAASSDRRTAWVLLALLGILALFGAGVDMAAIALESRSLDFVEDAGEMLIISMIVWYVHRQLELSRPREALGSGLEQVT